MPNRYQHFTREIPPDNIADLCMSGNGFAILSLSGVDNVGISFDGVGVFDKFEDGTGIDGLKTFERITIKNSDAVNSASIEGVIYHGKFNDNRFKISAPIKIDDSSPVNVSQTKTLTSLQRLVVEEDDNADLGTHFFGKLFNVGNITLDVTIGYPIVQTIPLYSNSSMDINAIARITIENNLGDPGIIQYTLGD